MANTQSALNKMISGEIAYRTLDNELAGREVFDLLFYEQGCTLRAQCEMNNIGLLRDVSLALDHEWLPKDAFCRLINRDGVSGSCWYFFNETSVLVEGENGGVRFSQQLSNQPGYHYLGLHPLQGDALIAQQVDNSRPGEFVPVNSLTNSISENGDGGLMATGLVIEVAFLGMETVTVTAGSFNARKLALRWHRDWPPATLWVREGDALFLKMTWSQVDYWYELVSLVERG
ncbi:hypothetical protein [Halioxenophilus sp. WMMB6]|uniref:hypothetical protein n=1 Tax=Halioxenophilus sp. WMMB6 TaxID=3073815 RepID=UPI00295E5E82|nr:hypothetical protein [Halioxenophilus sp. WMMB6]